MSDAKRAGYDLDALLVDGVHTDRSMTEDYIKQREVPVSIVRLHPPIGYAKQANQKPSNYLSTGHYRAKSKSPRNLAITRASIWSGREDLNLIRPTVE